MLFCFSGLLYPAYAQSSDRIITASGFVENKGQIKNQDGEPNVSVRFLLPLPGNNICLRSDGFSYDTYSVTGAADGREQDFHFHRVDVVFEGANPHAELVAEGETGVILNYHTGAETITGVRQYNRVTYRNIYPDIDVEFLSRPGTTHPVEYNFILHPGADIRDIRLRYNGAFATRLEEGALHLSLQHGDLMESIPASYRSGSYQPVSIGYQIVAGDDHSITMGFAEASGMHRVEGTEDLIIDPLPTLAWGTFYGGFGFDQGYSAATDGSSNIYLTGETASTTAIATAGAYQTTKSGTFDAFVAKFNSAGTLVWATYLGGSGTDTGFGITTDASGNVYVTGSTASNTGIASCCSYQTSNAGGYDIFLSKFNSAGTLQWSTYYGGTADDEGRDVVTDGAGNVYITGSTGSLTSIATAGGFQTSNAGSDAFLVKFSSAGALIWGTYYGDTGGEVGYSLAADGANNIYIAGITQSASNLASTGAYQTSMNGGTSDAFLVKFNSAGSRLWGTYYGGFGADIGYGVVTDASNNVYLTGQTGSSSLIATAGAHQTAIGGGGSDGFLVKFNSTGTRQWGTYYGGTAFDDASGLAIDAGNNVYLIGSTSSAGGISTSWAHQTALGGGSTDAYLVKFNSSGVRQWGTYHGGNGADVGLAVFVDGSGRINITGRTTSTNAMAPAGGYQTVNGGSTDLFLAQFLGFSPLPVELLYFQATCEQEHIRLDWATASELNNAYFVAEGSTDGVMWTELGRQTGAGNSNTTLSYTFMADALFDDLRYYRLSQVDYDGTVTTYDPVSHAPCMLAIPEQFSVYPNPAADMATVYFYSGQVKADALLELTDVSGHVQWQRMISLAEGENRISLHDLAALHPGVYLLRLHAEGVQQAPLRLIIY